LLGFGCIMVPLNIEGPYEGAARRMARPFSSRA